MFDKYGNPPTKKLDNIEKGDLVEYLDAKSSFIGKSKNTVKISLLGYWDGERVVFPDKEQTTVRTIHWLKLRAKNLRNIISKK